MRRPLEQNIRLVRLRAQRAVLVRLDAGYGFSDWRSPSEVWLHDPAARQWMGPDPLRPKGTHRASLSALDEEIATTLAELNRADTPHGLGERFGLDEAEVEVLFAAIGYALDPDTASLCHALSGRPAALWGDVLLEICPLVTDPRHLFAILGPVTSLRRPRLIVTTRSDDTGRPILGEAFTANPGLLRRLCQSQRTTLPLSTLLTPLEEARVYHDPAVLAELRAVAAMLQRRPASHASVVLVGPVGCGKQAAAWRLADELQQPSMQLNLRLLLSRAAEERAVLLADALLEARLRNSVVYLPRSEILASQQADAPSASEMLDVLGDHPGTLVFATGNAGAQAPPLERPFHVIRVPRPSQETRAAAWLEGLHETALDNDDALELADRYVVGPGTIAAVIGAAKEAVAACDRPIALRDLENALARSLSLDLGAFGALVTRRARLDEIVAPDDVIEALRDLLAMVRHRARILEAWGYARHLGLSRGVSALFLGSPGTGKTMAASAVAGELGLPLFRIDIATVLSKWIGETEKHLARIFDQAQNAHALLLFDEADALFSKRTDVRSSTDRYSNVEINYLLQRIETFDGLCILTSNLEGAIDKAFMRRLNFRVRFPDPGVDERRLLWQKLLPAKAEVDPDIDYDSLAQEFEMSGGHIRNSIVRAAVLAARRGSTIEFQDLVGGARLESFELGKVTSSLLR